MNLSHPEPGVERRIAGENGGRQAGISESIYGTHDNAQAENKESADDKSDRIQKTSLISGATLKALEFSRPKFSAGAAVTGRKNTLADPAAAQTGSADESFQWRPALLQSFLFLGIQHGYAFTQPKTRHALKGNFFKDYVDSVKSLHGWDDGGRFFTNYIAHPMQGSLTGYIQIQNDPKGRKQEFGNSKAYWQSRLKALAWSAAWSTQFEIGPISQASIGNVGLKGKQTWGDIVTTPTAGFALMIGEDAFDRFLIRRIERRSDNFYVKVFSRMLLNPTRTLANTLRFKAPWYRDRPTDH